MKYCSQQCRLKGYAQARKEAKQRYKKSHKKINKKKCAWCGKEFISTFGCKYCCIQHRKLMQAEQSRRTSIKYMLKDLSDKQRYFRFLGNSNLREHKHDCFEDEERLVKAEKRRLHL